MIKNSFLKKILQKDISAFHLNFNYIKKSTFNKNLINTFNFSENIKNKPRYIKVIKGENDEKKIIFEDFQKFEQDAEINKEIPIVNKTENFINKKSKLKFFGGDPKLEINKKEKINKSLKEAENNFNIFNKAKEEKIAQEEKIRKFEESKKPEELTENILNYNQFFSDYCRIYVKAGDGGNGSISVLKGHMFDQGKFCLF